MPEHPVACYFPMKRFYTYIYISIRTPYKAGTPALPGGHECA
jgi:hypothetical protein